MASFNEVDGVPSHASRWLLRDAAQVGLQGASSSPIITRFWEFEYRPDTHGAISWRRTKRKPASFAVKAGVNIELPGIPIKAICSSQGAGARGGCSRKRSSMISSGRCCAGNRRIAASSMTRTSIRCKPTRSWAGAMRTGVRAARGARDHHPAQERRRRPAARPLRADDHRRDRPERRPQPARRLQRRPVARRVGAAGHPGQRRRPCDGRLQRRMQDHPLPAASSADLESEASEPDEARKQHRRGGEKSPQHADVIVLCIGGNEQTSREAWNRGHMGDRARRSCFSRQQELVRRRWSPPVAADRARIQRAADRHFRAPRWRTCRRSSSAGTSGRSRTRRRGDALFGDYNPGR